VLARITLEVRGDLAQFPGLVPTALSLTLKDSWDVDQLVQFTDSAQFFSRPDGGHSRRPDARTYLLRIELGERSRALTIADPINDKEVARLIRFVRTLAAAREGQPPNR
jgi:hypothetical protein